MRTSRILGAGSVALAAVLALSACSAGNNTADGKGKTITVWAMTGDLSTTTLNAINKKFTEETGAKVTVQTQQWSNIATKITTALATSTPPDVLDLGNTQVATFAASGGLADLTAHKSDLEQGQTWLGGLIDPGTVDGKLYGVPSFGAARAVVYNKSIWSKAGITQAPTSYQELQKDLDAVKAANPGSDFSAFYMPGQYWYAGMQWVWDAGGNIATQKNGKWTAGFSSADAQKGLAAWKQFQNTYSSVASQTLDTDNPDQDAIFASGKASAILANNWEISAIEKDNPQLSDSDIGSFPLPSSDGHNQPVLLSGSNWGIAQKSPNQDLALEWVKIATSPSIQKNYVFGVDKWIPNSVEESKTASTSSILPANGKAFFVAAQNSKATPASGNWASLESPGMTQFFQTVASGTKSLSDAATEWDATINSTLNQ